MVLERGNELGQMLAECPADKGKIAFQASWRMAFCILLDIMNFGGFAAIRHWNEVPPEISIIFTNIILTVVFGLFPLIRLREYLAFYEYGIVYRKKKYFWSELGEARWRNYTYGGIFRSLYMDTDRKVFDVTYVTDPKKQYNKAYLNQ